MKSRILSCTAAIIATLLTAHIGRAQAFISVDEDSTGTSSSTTGYVTLPPSTAPTTRSFRPFTRVGFATHAGLAGAGFDIATPLSRKFNLRAGSDFFTYATTFQTQGANVGVNLRMRSSHSSLDWFPFGGRFRLSPQVVFANSNHIAATALIPSGSSITLNGSDYVSSATDPLHGSSTIDFRRVSPGFTLGFGNIIPRTKSHFTIPIEAGFYYVGQPALQVNFSGSACDPTQPASIGCQSVNQDPGFQKSLAAFIARNNNNLSYAKFFPTLSIGFGFSF